jgi:hypothetical protein
MAKKRKLRGGTGVSPLSFKLTSGQVESLTKAARTHQIRLSLVYLNGELKINGAYYDDRFVAMNHNVFPPDPPLPR